MLNNQPEMFKVLILYKSLPQYRIAFFNLLRKELLKNNISLKLVYGDADYKGRNDSATVDWAIFKKNKFIKIGNLNLIWQPCLKEIKSADVVIVEQADKLLINYLLIFKSIIGLQKLAFWGHGQNMQSHRKSMANKFKRLYINHCDWWFAYTDGIKKFLVENGYSAKKITTVQNALDTRCMHHQYNSISNQEIELLKKQYEIQENEIVLIYCGALYREKRLEFIIASVDKVVEKGYKIKLVIVGGGPDEYVVKEAALSRRYILLTGPKFGREKAMYFKLSNLFLLPGAMGLAILDSFAFATPIITTKYAYHGPEIEYLKNDINGIITENDLTYYTEAIIDLLTNSKKLETLSKNCVTEIKKYSNEIMVDNFVKGIMEIRGLRN